MNQKSFTLKIQKRTPFEWLTLWMILLPLLWGLLFSLLRLPGVVKYTADIAWLILALGMFFRKETSVRKTAMPLLITVVGFFVYAVVVYLFRYQSPLYFLWGVRNNFRYYVFFFAIIFFVKLRDVEKIFRFLDVAFWINAVVTFVQYFAFGYKQDYLGGIFGTEKGCNAYAIVFLSIVVGYTLLRFMDRFESLPRCFLKCAVAILISVIAELKVFFVLFVIILIMAAFFTRFSWRKVLLVLISAFMVFVGATILIELFKWENFLSLENIWKLATQENYSSEKTVNRLSAIPTLAKLILHDPLERIFGLGLGNCETSTFEFLNTPFYQKYSYLRYTWFSCARLFLEVGYIGVLLYAVFFAVCFILIFNLIRKGKCNVLYGQLAIIMSVICIALMFYNSSLHMEAGYMMYFVLALPFLGVENFKVQNE